MNIFKKWLAEANNLNLIFDAFMAIYEAGMSIEVSSAGLRKSCREIYPCKELMIIASQLNIPVCFGSDAHCKNTVGFAFEILTSYVSEFGYRSYQIFERGRPHCISF